MRPPSPVCPNNHPQVIVEPFQPRLGNLDGFKVGQGRTRQARLGVDQRVEFPIDQDVILGAYLRRCRLARIGIAPRSQPIPVRPGHSQLARDRCGIARPVEAHIGRAVDLRRPRRRRGHDLRRWA